MCFGKKKEEKPPDSCKLYSGKYFQLCAVGGALACGLTHLLVTPLDVVKCRLQVDPQKYGSLFKGFGVSYREGGFRNLTKGWAPTLIGYSKQGAVKFAGYEYFKYKYGSWVGEENAYLYRTYLYLAASASAEVLADIALSPWEAIKVRMQTSPFTPSRCFMRDHTFSMREVASKMYKQEGLGVFFRGLPALWGRQVPYTMMKFASFERVLEYLYANVVPKKREQCTKGEQLIVTFAAGYIAGVLCAIVSHPADMMVSKMNKDPSVTAGSVLRNLGFMGMWTGLGARIIMIGTLTGLQWFIYDAFKVYTRMPRPDPGEMPASLKKKEKKYLFIDGIF